MQVAANLLQRDIIIIPTRPESAPYINKYCIIRGHIVTNPEPITVLWFEEFIYGCGHYQSIEPDISIQQNQILTHYRWLCRNERSRIFSQAVTMSVGSIDAFEPEKNSTEYQMQIETESLICQAKQL